VNSILAYFVILIVLGVSVNVIFSCLNHKNKSMQFLFSLLLLSSLIILEISLTYESSLLRLNHIPVFHCILLIFTYVIFRKNKKNKVKLFARYQISLATTKNNFIKKENVEATIYSIFGFLSILIGIYPGLLGGPSTVDERAYHWPQILGIIQNNGFTTFDSTHPWTSSYPLGKAQMMSFTWPWIHSDLGFRAVQILFGLIAILSIYSIGRILSRRVGLLASLLFAASPVFSVMLRMASDDLAFGAFTIAAIAMLIYSYNASESTELKQYLLFGSISFALAGQFKFPALTAALCLPIMVAVVVKHSKSLRNTLEMLAILSLGVLIGSVYLIRNLLDHQNPFYPMTVNLFGKTIFEGPLINLDTETLRPSTTFSIDAPYKTLKLWHATFFDWFQPPNEDSLGSYNFLVGMLILVLIIYAFMYQKNFPFILRILFNTLILALILFPALFIPRYGFVVVMLLSIFGTQILMTYQLKFPTFLALGALCLMGLTPIVIQNSMTKQWIYSQLGAQNALENGQSAIDRKYDLANDGTVASASAVRWIQSNVKENQKVCYSAATNYPSSFWNLSRTSKVKYAPILESDRYPNSNKIDAIYSKSELDTWINVNLDCDYLIAYRTNKDLLLTTDKFKESSFDSKDKLLILEKNK
jgi:hypothetical protein